MGRARLARQHEAFSCRGSIVQVNDQQPVNGDPVEMQLGKQA